jgi:hypothetical protein
MSSKSPIPVIFVAFVCSLLAWVIFVHIFSQALLPVIMVCPIILSAAGWVYGFFAGLTLCDTIRRRGMFGINFKRVVCPRCGIRLRRGITFPSHKELLWGGWTCHECGLELSHWGRPWKEQNTLAKWAVLRAAEDANERKRRPQRQEERIRNGNDQTKRRAAS